MKILFNRRGATLVEFALILPLLIILIFGIIEFGLIMYDQQVITNAAREGARYGIVMTDPLNDGDNRTPDLIMGVATNYASTHLITLGSAGGNFTSTAGAPTPGGYCDTLSSGTPLTVSVTYDYAFLVVRNFLPSLSPVIQLASTAVMNCE